MPEEKLSLPFLTREMLKFDHGTTFALQVTSRSTTVERVFISGMTREGNFSFSFVTNGNGVQETQTFRIPDVPIFVSTDDGGNAFSFGTIFMVIALTANENVLQQLTSGYVYNLHHLSWPNQQNAEPRAERGFFDTITGSNPAAGDEIDEDVATAQIWRIQSIFFTLVTDATAIARRVHFVVTLLGNPILHAFSDQDQTASLTRNYTCAPFGALPDTLDANEILIPIPHDLLLSDAVDIETVTTNLQAGDNFAAPVLIIERWLR